MHCNTDCTLQLDPASTVHSIACYAKMIHNQLTVSFTVLRPCLHCALISASETCGVGWDTAISQLFVAAPVVC